MNAYIAFASFTVDLWQNKKFLFAGFPLLQIDAFF